MAEHSCAGNRYPADALFDFANRLLQQAGLVPKMAEIVAETLLEADLMGHSTHGLQLLAPYLTELERDQMTKTGKPEIIADYGDALTWDAKYLPGPYVIRLAMDTAFERIQAHPVVTIVAKHSHHTACLAVYPERATKRGLLMLLATNDPRAKIVAPFGGLRPVYSPDPLAVGIPTHGDPIIIDISMSSTAHGQVLKAQREGKMLPHDWLLDNAGKPTNDPAALSTTPPGSILPLGGPDLGYKGFALGLMMEALTAALSGHGRADEPTRWGNSVFLQLINPVAFGGIDAFLREIDWLTEACRANPVKPGNPPVRLPGSRALQLKAEQLAHGVALDALIVEALRRQSEKFGVPFPEELHASL